MSKHTPGPWKFNGPHIYAPEADDRGSMFYDIAHSCGFMDDEGEANARLIAAAPDLLEACRLAATMDIDAYGCLACGAKVPVENTDDAERDGKDGYIQHASGCWLAAVNAAIAKAEGKA